MKADFEEGPSQSSPGMVMSPPFLEVAKLKLGGDTEGDILEGMQVSEGALGHQGSFQP